MEVIWIVGGKKLIERVIELKNEIRVIIEFMGGILFIIIIVRGKESW